MVHCAEKKSDDWKPPPKPPGDVPGLGHFPLIGLGALGAPGLPPPHIMMDKLAKQFGDVISLRFGSKDVVLLSSPGAVEQALCTGDPRTTAGRPSLASVLANGLTQGLSSAVPNKDWQVIRSTLLQKAFAARGVDQAACIIDNEASRLVETLRHFACGDGTPVAVRPMLRHSITTLLFRWALSLGHDSDMSARLEAVVEEAWNTMADPVVIAADFTGTPGMMGSMPRIRRERTALLRDLVVHRKRAQKLGLQCKQDGHEDDFLDALLHAQKKHRFDDDVIIEAIGSLTTAGISTVATVLEWLVLLLADHPEYQSRARQDALGCGEDRFLDACILETMRLKTPLFVPRRCLKDIEVDSWHLEADTLLLPNTYSLAHDEALWKGGPVDGFHPDRFLGPERPLLDHRPAVRPKCPFSSMLADNHQNNDDDGAAAFKFLPFGVGARFCPGSSIALAELRSFTSALLTEFEWCLKGHQNLSEAYSLTLSPAQPAKVVFRSR